MRGDNLTFSSAPCWREALSLCCSPRHGQGAVDGVSVTRSTPCPTHTRADRCAGTGSPALVMGQRPQPSEQGGPARCPCGKPSAHELCLQSRPARLAGLRLKNSPPRAVGCPETVRSAGEEAAPSPHMRGKYSGPLQTEGCHPAWGQTQSPRAPPRPAEPSGSAPPPQPRCVTPRGR